MHIDCRDQSGLGVFLITDWLPSKFAVLSYVHDLYWSLQLLRGLYYVVYVTIRCFIHIHCSEINVLILAKMFIG